MKTENIHYERSDAHRIVRYLVTIMCLSFLFSACATSPHQAQWKQDAVQPLTCTKGPDCEANGRAP